MGAKREMERREERRSLEMETEMGEREKEMKQRD